MVATRRFSCLNKGFAVISKLRVHQADKIGLTCLWLWDHVSWPGPAQNVLDRGSFEFHTCPRGIYTAQHDSIFACLALGGARLNGETPVLSGRSQGLSSLRLGWATAAHGPKCEKTPLGRPARPPAPLLQTCE
jgi:hypothetical protein